ncbi:MAG: hypothetical protein AABW91_03885 [Nanoarchaeota archaeon]
MSNKNLVAFIKEARKRGYTDHAIRKPLLEKGWSIQEIENAFSHATAKIRIKSKNKITIYLDSDVLNVLEKRSNKNLLTLSEQIEDILRRSVLNTKKTKKIDDKIDDKFIAIFSRRNYKKKNK